MNAELQHVQVELDTAVTDREHWKSRCHNAFADVASEKQVSCVWSCLKLSVLTAAIESHHECSLLRSLIHTTAQQDNISAEDGGSSSYWNKNSHFAKQLFYIEK